MKKDIKFISERISFRNLPEETTIIITAKIERSKESLLLAWILAWTFCGVYFFLQLFGDYPKEQKLYFFIFLSFWAYFEYKMIYVFRYRRWGNEYIRIADGKLFIKRSVSKYGKSNEFLIDNIKNLQLVTKNEKGFWQQMEKSFWNLGDESISFEYQGKTLFLGIQLSEKEAKNVLKLIIDSVKK